MIIGPAVRWGCHYRPIGGGRTTVTNITNNYSGSSVSSCGGGMSWIGGLMSFLPMMFMAIPFFGGLFGRRNNPVPEQQMQPAVDNNLNNLKTLFKDIDWVPEGNGRYTGRDKDGVLHTGTYDELKAKLNKGLAAQNPGQQQGNVFTKDEAAGIIKGAGLEGKITIDDDGNIKYTAPGASEETVLEGLTTTNIGKAIAAFNTREVQNDGVEDGQAVPDDVAGQAGAAGKAGAAGNTDANKKGDGKGLRLNMIIATTTRSSNGTATVVTPDGKTYKVTVHTSGTPQERCEKLSAAMKEALPEEYKDAVLQVTFPDDKFNWTSDGSEVADVTPSKKKEYTADQKAKHHDFTIAFAVRSGFNVGNSGSATVTTPDGKVYQVTTGVSLTPQRARNDLVAQMKAALQAAGWSDFTLVNSNEDWVGNDASFKAS